MSDRSIRALIVDDEELARENLRLMLADECPEVEIVGTADSVESAHRTIAELDPDLLLLDIRMSSGAEGLDLLEELPDLRAMVVFVTAFKDYAVQAFHANAVDYILKPIDPEELRKAITKAGQRIAQLSGDPGGQLRYRTELRTLAREIREHGAERIAVDYARGFKLFDPHTIAHLEADGNCTVLHFTDGSRYLDTRHLKTYEDLLDPTDFMRTHRSHVINLACLREYLRDDGHWAVMKSGVRVPIARNRLEAFLQAARR